MRRDGRTSRNDRYLFAASFRDDSAERDGHDSTTKPLPESQHYLGLDSLVISKGLFGE